MFEFIKNIFNRRQKTMINVDLTEIEQVIQEHLNSQKYREMIDGNKYFAGQHDVLKRLRQAIGEAGALTNVSNLPNNRIVDNQYKKLVKQKVNYILSKSPTFSAENESEPYEQEIQDIFNKSFLRTLKRVGVDVFNNGIGWMYAYYENNKLKFKKLNAVEIIPVWADNEHSQLNYAIRIYRTRAFVKKAFVETDNVEIYTKEGIEYYELKTNKLIQKGDVRPYLTVGEQAFNWENIPLIAFRAEELEQPLLKRVKVLQDTLNELMSDFANNMQEDTRNTILMLKNYDGEDLGEFRRNLSTYGAVKVSDDGDLKSLSVEVNAANYEAIVNLLKKSIIENGAGFDAKSDTLGGNPNQLNIRSMYSDIDLEANDLENEFQASFEELMWFVNSHIANKGVKFTKGGVDLILNRDILINESQAISDIKNSIGLLSNETLVEQHPYIQDATKELERLKTEQDKQTEQLYGSNINATGDTSNTQGEVDGNLLANEGN